MAPSLHTETQCPERPRAREWRPTGRPGHHSWTGGPYPTSRLPLSWTFCAWHKGVAHGAGKGALSSTPSPRWRNTQGHFLLKETAQGTACGKMHSKDWVCREGAYPKTRKSPNPPAIDLDRGPVRAPDPIDRGLGSVESVPELNNPIELLKS